MHLKNGVHWIGHQCCAFHGRHFLVSKYQYKPHEWLPILVFSIDLHEMAVKKSYHYLSHFFAAPVQECCSYNREKYHEHKFLLPWMETVVFFPQSSRCIWRTSQIYIIHRVPWTSTVSSSPLTITFWKQLSFYNVFVLLPETSSNPFRFLNIPSIIFKLNVWSCNNSTDCDAAHWSPVFITRGTISSSSIRAHEIYKISPSLT